MTSKTQDNDPSSTDATLSATEIHSILTSERRRRALRYLSTQVAAISLDHLAEYVAAREAEPTPERTQRIRVGLYHVHLPKLTDAGVVEYDADAETVTLSTSAADLAPQLELDAAGDPQ